MTSPLDLSSAVLRESPFKCFTATRVVSVELEQHLLDWFEDGAPWRLKIADFYEQYEFSFCDASVPPSLRSMFSEAGVAAIRDKVGKLLGARLGSVVDVTAHRLVGSQTIRIHNDFRPAGETHRFLVQINRGWTIDNGGLLMLFRGPTVESVDAIIEPTSRSAFGFCISATSFHAVSKVNSGSRYTIVYSFYEEAGAPH